MRRHVTLWSRPRRFAPGGIGWSVCSPDRAERHRHGLALSSHGREDPSKDGPASRKPGGAPVQSGNRFDQSEGEACGDATFSQFFRHSGLAPRGAYLYEAPDQLRRGGRVVECTALEMRHGGNSIGGSNPSLSAIYP